MGTRRYLLILCVAAWSGGCFLAREVKQCVTGWEATARQVDWVGLRLGYVADLQRHATRSGADPFTLAAAGEGLWQEAFAAARPAPPVALPPLPPEAPGRVFPPVATPPAPPPLRKRTVTPLGGGIQLLREPDGRLILTNRPEAF